MSNRELTASKRRRALPSLVLAATAAAFVLASGAAADEPPIVTIGSAGGPVSASVGSDPQADACVGDQSSGAGTESNVVDLNEGTCSSGSGSSSGGSSSGGGGSAARPTGGAQTASSASARGATAWVAATQAVGLRIVRVRQLTKGVRLTKRFGVVVTLRDARGRLVRGGIVTIGRVPGARSTIANTYSNVTNKAGNARLVVPVTRTMFGKRLFLKISAHTPKARAIALRSVSLPKLR